MEYRLQVSGPENSARELRVQADSPAAAMRVAQASGVRVLAIQADQVKTVEAQSGFDLTLFSQELVALLEAGLSVTAALSALASKERRAASRALVRAIVEGLEEGRSLSECLGRYPAIFPQVYVAGIRANERTGGLANALTRYVGYRTQIDALKRKIVSASIYPVLLLTVGFFVTLFLVGFVVPKFAAVYDSAGRDVPLLSLLLISAGAWINSNLTIFLLLLAVTIAAVLFALARSSTRTRLVLAVTRLPWVRQRAREYRLGRLYRTIGLLVLSGIPLPKAVAMATDALSEHERDAMQRVRRTLDEGCPLSEALRREAMSTTIGESLIRVGESSGRLGEMLERAARFHDDDFARWIEVATRVVEPLLMVVIGLVIGAIVVFMYLPIFELAGNIG
jgi:general secretion pathway protein F